MVVANYLKLFLLNNFEELSVLFHFNRIEAAFGVTLVLIDVLVQFASEHYIHKLAPVTNSKHRHSQWQTLKNSLLKFESGYI